MTNRSDPAGVAVHSTLPLLRVGLESAVSSAGLRLTEPQHAEIHLRCGGPPLDGGIDVDVARDHVTVRIHGVPAPESWAALEQIVAAVSELDRPDPAAPPSAGRRTQGIADGTMASDPSAGA